jgi:predicted AAA+ superfamily ATPase
LINARLFQGKAIIVTGPRQVGKTTLIRHITEAGSHRTRWFNGDEPDTRELFSQATSSRLKALIGEASLVVIDEAQRIENIGLAVKLLVDTYPRLQVLVTGSSSLELTNTINEPLTGRKYEFHLFPLSYEELAAHTGALEERRLLEHRMIFGYYPDVVVHEGSEQELLMNLCSSYLYKDLLAWQQIKKPMLLEKLLQGLALQIGNEVTYHELGQLAGIDTETAERYIDLLEKAFVVFRLPSLNRNMRNEIKKGRKVYFYDTGIRNALLKNFNPLAMRQDTGALWENFCIVERMKTNHYGLRFANRFFWRTVQQQEVDYLEEYNGVLHAYEFKWNPKRKNRFTRTFTTAYPGSTTAVITPENFEEFVMNTGLPGRLSEGRPQ